MLVMAPVGSSVATAVCPALDTGLAAVAIALSVAVIVPASIPVTMVMAMAVMAVMISIVGMTMPVVRTMHGSITISVSRISRTDADRIAGVAAFVASQAIVAGMVGAARQEEGRSDGKGEQLHDAISRVRTRRPHLALNAPVSHLPTAEM